MVLKKIFFLISILFFVNFHGAFAETIDLDQDKSKLTYTLTQFGIPFKRKPLPASGNLQIEKRVISSEKTLLCLQGIDLKARFVSKNPFFRKVINFDKYPELAFQAGPECQIELKNLEPIDFTGNLTFHGITKEINVELKPEITDKCIFFTGYLKIYMTDFGIKPPRILFLSVDNLIKTKIEIYSQLSGM